MKTAVVHDWLNGMRGGEKVLEAILPLVPNPTIFTLFHVPGSVSREIERYPIRASGLNRLPLARRRYRHYLPLYPRAIESFDLASFDLVVSSSHCVAKGAIARDGTPHLCYCHTPVRYAYEQFDVYFPRGATRFWSAKKSIIGRLRRWDQATADRPTRYLANSTAVADRIRRHYGRDSTVVHPPVDVEFFHGSNAGRDDFLLAVGSLVPYKRYDLAIAAARRLERPLVIVGKGPEERRLRALAPSSVRIVSGVDPEALRELYRTCHAFVQPGEEDFGISLVEALACGAPVAALGRGGARDTVRHGENGFLSVEDTAEALASAVENLSRISFDYTAVRATALPFARDRFDREFDRAISDVLQIRHGRESRQ
ncbi:MAG TPA: glycosyltransferase [Thermoanaerobaculia bacterium]|jgi:glycosyltransferase involved in cell wall biosynthesis|nr:glycosyltransferase [Thermoanaerobaculia bacterium]